MSFNIYIKRVDTHTYKGTNMTLANFNMENIVTEREREKRKEKSVFIIIFL